jgi:lipopolysaccharide/colanic/teichoic acid biosynthesis glycosyltransferase
VLTKRLFDITSAALAMIVLLPAILLVAVIIRIVDGPPVLFRQERMGRAGVPFVVLKFRTMRVAPGKASGITVGGDTRITRLGILLRELKIDELPQLVNVLKGEMSVVGPRPELEEFVQMFDDDYREILQLRPGLTDLASIKYRNEASLLAASENPRRTYLEEILPDKILLAKQYVRSQSLALDLKIVTTTLIGLFRR